MKNSSQTQTKSHQKISKNTEIKKGFNRRKNIRITDKTTGAMMVFPRTNKRNGIYKEKMPSQEKRVLQRKEEPKMQRLPVK